MFRNSAALLAASLLTAISAQAGARQDATVLMATGAADLKSQLAVGYADAVISGDTIYLSGGIALLENGETDLRLGYVRAFDHIAEILKRSGASWDDVVEITSFHTDMPTQMPAMIEVKKKYVTEPHPAWTAVGVTRLGANRAFTEIRIIARLPKKERRH